MFLAAPIQKILFYRRPLQKLIFILRDGLHGGRKIVAPGRSYKEDHVFCLHAKSCTCASARIFLDERQEDPSTRDKPDQNGG